MEIRKRAFFYNYRYYLYPDDAVTQNDVIKARQVKCYRLREQGCVAPDFTYDCAVEETVTINHPELLFDVTVTLHDEREYDYISEQQERKLCTGCIHAEDGTDCIPPVSGMCFRRAESETETDFAQTVKSFWEDAASIHAQLQKTIDKGNQQKLNQLLSGICSGLPARFYGGVREGKYYLIAECDYGQPPVERAAAAYLAEMANLPACPMKQAGWTVYPYREKGLFSYRGKTRFEACMARPVSLNETGYAVELYSAKELKEQRKRELCLEFYEYICAQIGERAAAFTVKDIKIVGGETKGMLPVTRLVEGLASVYARDCGEAVSYPAALYYGNTAEGGADLLPYRDRAAYFVTGCPDLSFLRRSQMKTAEWLDTYRFFYLYIPRAREWDSKVLSRYLAGGDGRAAGFSVGMARCQGEGFFIDCLVTSERAFFRKLQKIAPVLMSMQARLVTVKRQGIAVYRCGYAFTPVADE